MMTKRFIIDDCGTLIDIETRDTYDYVDNVCDLLNELYEEVEYLKPLANENTHYIEDMEDDIITFKQKIEKLEKENEQLKTKISFIIDNRIRVYQKYIKKCELMLKLNDNAKQHSDLFNAKVEELEQLKKELLGEL